MNAMPRAAGRSGIYRETNRTGSAAWWRQNHTVNNYAGQKPTSHAAANWLEWLDGKAWARPSYAWPSPCS